MWITDSDDILYTLAFVMPMLTIVTNEAVIRQEFHFNHEMNTGFDHLTL